MPGVASAALVTGGVHGYETSGVMGALGFLETRAEAYVGAVDLLVAPCLSPWAYERIYRWNYDAIDPNRSFRGDGPREATALIELVKPLCRPVRAAYRPARDDRQRRERIWAGQVRRDTAW